MIWNISFIQFNKLTWRGIILSFKLPLDCFNTRVTITQILLWITHNSVVSLLKFYQYSSPLAILSRGELYLPFNHLFCSDSFSNSNASDAAVSPSNNPCIPWMSASCCAISFCNSRTVAWIFNTDFSKSHYICWRAATEPTDLSLECFRSVSVLHAYDLRHYLLLNY